MKVQDVMRERAHHFGEGEEMETDERKGEPLSGYARGYGARCGEEMFLKVGIRRG
jgi:hypothetical protein